MTIMEIVRGLGGATKIAAQLGLKRPAVWAWSRNDSIPHKHHKALLLMAAKIGFAVTREQLEEPEAAEVVNG